jgi:hypothetical protein
MKFSVLLLATIFVLELKAASSIGTYYDTNNGNNQLLLLNDVSDTQIYIYFILKTTCDYEHNYSSALQKVKHREVT